MKNKDKAGKIQDQIDSPLLNDRKIFLWGQVDEKTAKHW